MKQAGYNKSISNSLFAFLAIVFAIWIFFSALLIVWWHSDKDFGLVVDFFWKEVSANLLWDSMATVWTVFTVMNLFIVVIATINQQEEMRKNEDRWVAEDEEKSIRLIFEKLENELNRLSYRGKSGKYALGELSKELTIPWKDDPRFRWQNGHSIEPQLSWVKDWVNEFNEQTEPIFGVFNKVRWFILSLRDSKLSQRKKTLGLNDLTWQIGWKWLIVFLYFELANNKEKLTEEMHDVLYELWLSRTFVAEYVAKISPHHVKCFMEENLAIKNLILLDYTQEAWSTN